MENKEGKKTIIEWLKNHFSKTAEEDKKEEIESDDIASSIGLIVVGVLIGLYFYAHQTGSTGFFTANFGTLEMVMLYGLLIFWIATSTLILIGRKNASRDLDSFGGLFFTVFGITWLFVIFPFEFSYFADVLPDFLRFLLQWISNDIARVLLVLLFILHLVAAVYSFTLRIYVRKARARPT